MLNYSDLKRGCQILFNGQPYEILESAPMFKGRGHSVLQTRIKNLVSGEVISYTFHPSDSFEDPEILKIALKFLFFHRDKYVFCQKDNPAKRFELEKQTIGSATDFLKADQEINGLMFGNKLVDISLPIKVILKVKEAPPAIKGQSVQGSTKPAILETGAKISVPLFVEAGDEIEVNTQTGTYTRRL